METGLERDVDEEDGGDEEVGGVVDGVVPQAGLQLPQERELARLGEALQADKRDIIPVLRIHDILVPIRIWIRGPMPLSNGSGSIRILLFLTMTRCQQKPI